MNQFLVLNGKITSLSEARISPFDHGFLYGDGVYETLRTFGGLKILDFAAHLHRLRASAKKLDIPLPYSDDEIFQQTEEVVCLNALPESRIRLSLTRGENHFSFTGAKNPTFLITVSPLADYGKFASGVGLATIMAERIAPEIKSISLLPMILGKQIAEKTGVFDAIFVDHQGFVTEGTVFNILFRKADTVITADPNAVLPGTAQRILMELAGDAGYKTLSKQFGVSELQEADEVIITNSLFGALPVQSIDQKIINACPGEAFEKCGKRVLAAMAHAL